MIAFPPYSSFVAQFMLLLGDRAAGGVGYTGSSGYLLFINQSGAISLLEERVWLYQQHLLHVSPGPGFPVQIFHYL